MHDLPGGTAVPRARHDAAHARGLPKGCGHEERSGDPLAGAGWDTGPRAMSSVRLVTFDVGGTLLRANPSVGAIYAEVLAKRGFPCEAEVVERAFEPVWERVEANTASVERYGPLPEGERRYWREMLRVTVRQLGGDEPPDGAADELFDRFARPESWRVFPEVPEILAELSRRGF